MYFDLTQGVLHPLLEHPETNLSRPGIESDRLRHRRALLQRAIRMAHGVAIRNLYSINIYNMIKILEKGKFKNSIVCCLTLCILVSLKIDALASILTKMHKIKSFIAWHLYTPKYKLQ
jgi:hypothetical protein